MLNSRIVMFAVEPTFSEYVSSAITRLGYVYPAYRFSAETGGISVSGALPDDPSDLRRDVLHMLYRERIFKETLPLRRRLLEALNS